MARVLYLDGFSGISGDMVREYIEAQGGTAASPDRRWDLFLALLQSPRLPSQLQ